MCNVVDWHPRNTFVMLQCPWPVVYNKQKTTRTFPLTTPLPRIQSSSRGWKRRGPVTWNGNWWFVHFSPPSMVLTITELRKKSILPWDTRMTFEKRKRTRQWMMLQFSINLLTNLRVEPLSGAHSAINEHLMKGVTWQKCQFNWVLLLIWQISAE